MFPARYCLVFFAVGALIAGGSTIYRSHYGQSQETHQVLVDSTDVETVTDEAETLHS